ncbi:phosphatase PAP2 family protein [Streptomyces sp. NPDC056944]|uniref:phosphatase PAP2 family protein n=1 Tax=Streptomyces sp. NPDC056944 TaxID=3345972 RepID=UPI00363C28EA
MDRLAEADVEPGPARRDTGGPARPVLNPALRAWFGPIAALAALAVGLLGIRYAGDGAPSAVDTRLQAAADGAGPWRWDLAHAVDFLGEPAGATLLVAATVAVCLLLRRPRAAVFVVAAVGLSVVTATLLKRLVGRTIHGGYLSFPSGHTAFLTAFALAVALLVAGRPGLGRAAGTSLVLAAGLAAGAVMGWAQVVLGAHYPTDTLGGWCTALAVVPATAWLVDRVAGREDRP